MFNFRYSLLIIIGVCLDQLTKYYASTQLSFFTPKVIIPSILDFQLVHNYGAAYGILQHQKTFLILITVIVLCGGCLYRHQIGQHILSKLGLCFLFIGAIGNLIDRVRLGYVIDFINIHIIPVFNIADISINICILLFISEIIFLRHNDSK